MKTTKKNTQGGHLSSITSLRSQNTRISSLGWKHKLDLQSRRLIELFPCDEGGRRLGHGLLDRDWTTHRMFTRYFRTWWAMGGDVAGGTPSLPGNSIYLLEVFFPHLRVFEIHASNYSCWIHPQTLTFSTFSPFSPVRAACACRRGVPVLPPPLLLGTALHPDCPPPPRPFCCRRRCASCASRWMRSTCSTFRF